MTIADPKYAPPAGYEHSLMPAPSLDSSRAKIKRAKEHYAALVRDAEITMAGQVIETGGPQRMTVRKERDAEPGKIHFVVETVPQADPFRWGLYVGDIVQNLRSALDHLVFALADKDTPGRGEDRATQFVIVGTSAEFKNVRWHLKHLSTHHQGMIEQEQPYIKHPADVAIHPLSWLERLSNIDKHHVIHVVRFAADLFSYRNPSPFLLTNAQLTSQVIYENPLEEGAKLMTVTIAKSDPNGPEPDVDIEAVAFRPTLALGPGQLIKYIAPNLTNYVADLVERFAGEF